MYKSVLEAARNIEEHSFGSWILFIPLLHLLSHSPEGVYKRGETYKHPSWWGVTDIKDMIQGLKKLHSNVYAIYDFISRKKILEYVVSDFKNLSLSTQN